MIGEREATSEEVRLAAAVPRRRTVRTPFQEGEVPVPLRVAWREHAEAEGGVLRWVERIGERSGVARLVAEADRQQQHDPAYLEELRLWTAPERVAEGSGVPTSTFGVTPEVGHAAEFTPRDFGAGRRSDEQRHAGPLEEHPLVAVLATATDSAEDWLAAARHSCGCCSPRPMTVTSPRTSTSRSRFRGCGSSYATSCASPAGPSW